MDKNYEIDIIENQAIEQTKSFIPEIKKNEQEVRIKILNKVADLAFEVIEINKKHEESKARWRKFFIIVSCVLLGGLISCTLILLFFGKLTDIQLSLLTTSIIANLIAVFFFMIKYAHNDLYLDTFKTVTKELFEYFSKTTKDDNTDKT